MIEAIDRNERCTVCGLPRHAHWGGPSALAYGRCSGFESGLAIPHRDMIRAAARDALDTAAATPFHADRATIHEAALRRIIEIAEGRP